MSQKSNGAIAVVAIDIGNGSFDVVGHDRLGAMVSGTSSSESTPMITANSSTTQSRSPIALVLVATKLTQMRRASDKNEPAMATRGAYLTYQQLALPPTRLITRPRAHRDPPHAPSASPKAP
jgi:hypothetical protein